VARFRGINPSPGARRLARRSGCAACVRNTYLPAASPDARRNGQALRGARMGLEARKSAAPAPDIKPVPDINSKLLRLPWPQKPLQQCPLINIWVAMSRWPDLPSLVVHKVAHVPGHLPCSDLETRHPQETPRVRRTWPQVQEPPRVSAYELCSTLADSRSQCGSSKPPAVVLHPL
jgi:hypothetical protein